MVSSISMPSSAAKARACSSNSALTSTTTNAHSRRSAAASKLLSALPTVSSPPSRVSASSHLFPALSPRGRRVPGRTSSLVPLNSYDRDVYRRVPPPASPPPLTEPVPPPPPPPPRKNGFLSGGGAWITAFFVGLALWYGFLISDVPQIRTGSDGFSYVTTKGGNRVLIAEDEAGRTFLVDQDANLYYDSGIEEVGWYIVGGKDGEVTNLFYDAQNDGKLTRRAVGNIKDLKQVDAQALAGIRIDEVDQDEFLKGTDDATEANTIVGFSSGENGDGGDEDFRFLPPNAPLTIGEDGALKGPPVLEEGVLTLKAKKDGAPLKPRKGDRLDQLVELFDAATESGAGAPVGSPLAEGFSLPRIPAAVEESAPNGGGGGGGGGK